MYLTGAPHPFWGIHNEKFGTNEDAARKLRVSRVEFNYKMTQSRVTWGWKIRNSLGNLWTNLRLGDLTPSVPGSAPIYLTYRPSGAKFENSASVFETYPGFHKWCRVRRWNTSPPALPFTPSFFPIFASLTRRGFRNTAHLHVGEISYITLK